MQRVVEGTFSMQENWMRERMLGFNFSKVCKQVVGNAY